MMSSYLPRYFKKSVVGVRQGDGQDAQLTLAHPALTSVQDCRCSTQRQNEALCKPDSGALWLPEIPDTHRIRKVQEIEQAAKMMRESVGIFLELALRARKGQDEFEEADRRTQNLARVFDLLAGDESGSERESL